VALDDSEYSSSIIELWFDLGSLPGVWDCSESEVFTEIFEF